MSAALVVSALCKQFDGHVVLDSVGFSVAPGELVTILGKSGSGKTTLLRLICGFDWIDGGTITIGGHLVSGGQRHVPPERRGLGYVAQEGALFPHLTVGENILFGLPRAERREARAAALLDRVGLAPSFSRRGPHQLSGGEQQRVALARALAPSPKLVLLDEPFSALDAALRKESRLAVAKSLAEAGTAAILVTHDQAEALSLGHRVGVLRDGQLVQIDSPTNLYRRPVDLDLARFVGEALVLPAEANGRTASCCLGEVSLQTVAQGRVLLLLRPEQLQLETNGPGHVRAVDFLGSQAAVQIELEETIVTAIVPGHRVPTCGEWISVRVEGKAVVYVPESCPGARDAPSLGPG